MEGPRAQGSARAKARRPRRARPGQGVAGAGTGGEGGEGGVRRRTKVAARATADFGALRSNIWVFRQNECVLRSTFVYEDGPGRWEEGERESREDTGGALRSPRKEVVAVRVDTEGRRSRREDVRETLRAQRNNSSRRPSSERWGRAQGRGCAALALFPKREKTGGEATAEQGVCGGGSPGLGVGRTAGRRRVTSARAAAPTEAPAAASSIGGRSAPPRRGAGLPGLATGQLSHRSDVR